MIEFPESVERALRTAVVYIAILALGMCTAIPGPTLLDLEAIVNTETSSLSLIYLGRSLGYLFGSFTGGVFLDRCKMTEILLLLYTFLMAVTTIIIPWCRTLSFLIGIMTFSGIAMGSLDTGLNVWCLSFWEEKGSPYFQALHFFFGVGAFLAPLIAGPFLSHKKVEENKNSSQKIYEMLLSKSQNKKSIPPVTYVYSIIGVFSLFSAILFALSFLFNINERQSVEKTSYKNPPARYRFAVLFLSLLLLGVYAGIEIGFGQMIAVYAVKSNHSFSLPNASYIASLYWGTFTLSRAFSILLALKLSPFSLVVGDCVIMAFAAFILMTIGRTNSSFLCVGSSVLGLGLASFYASSITWIEMHISVTNKVGSYFVIAASFGEMVAPLAISQFVKKQPDILMYFIAVSVGFCVFFVIVLRVITSRIGIKQPVLVAENEPEQSELTGFVPQSNSGPEQMLDLTTKPDVDESCL